MKANELMIGDWVCYCKTNNWLTKVEAVNNPGQTYISDVYGIKCYRVKDDPLYEKAPIDFFNVDILHPIPLTAEILEKNGFVMYDAKDKAYRLELEEGVYVNADFKTKEPFVSVSNKCYRATPMCKYVHQLQHALRLCGIEKEIKL